jgi:hypothetical protein
MKSKASAFRGRWTKPRAPGQISQQMETPVADVYPFEHQSEQIPAIHHQDIVNAIKRLSYARNKQFA